MAPPRTRLSASHPAQKLFPVPSGPGADRQLWDWSREKAALPQISKIHPTKVVQKRIEGQWIADVTYIWTVEGWLYVAVVIDLFTHRVVGWLMSDTMTAELVTNALMMVI